MKTIKIFTLTILGWLCSLSLWAYDFQVGSLYYTITSLEKLEVEVTWGDWTDDSSADVKYKGDIVIPETINYKGRDFKVTGVGGNAFANCTGLTSINFGNVQTIGENAFQDCTGLISIDFKNVKTIKSSAFAGCTGLTSIDFKNVQTIGEGAFTDCRALTSIDFKNVQTIGWSAFYECTGLTSIDFGNVQTIEVCAFYECTGLTSIDFKNVQTIGEGAFTDCRALTSIDFKNVQTIEEYAFFGCSSVSSVDLGSMTSIPSEIKHLLYELTHISLGNLQTIPDYTFSSCDKLTYIKSTQKEPPTLGNKGFTNAVYLNATLEVPAGCKGAYLQAEGWKNFFTVVESGEADKIPLIVSCSEGGQVDFTNYSVSGSSTSAPFSSGEKVKMTFTAHKGYALQSVVVDGKDVTSEVTDHTYTVTMDTEKSVKVTFIKLPVYLTLQQADNGQMNLKVEGGKSYQFKLEAAEGWKINTVTFNAVDVTADLDADNNYETPTITENSKLIVSFELVVPSAITDVDVNPVSVKGLDSQLVIAGAREGDCITVYTAEGAMVSSEISDGLIRQIRVEPHHVYIVKVGTRTFKVGL